VVSSHRCRSDVPQTVERKHLAKVRRCCHRRDGCNDPSTFNSLSTCFLLSLQGQTLHSLAVKFPKNGDRDNNSTTQPADKMMKTVQLLFVAIGFLPSVWGSATLVPKVSTAQCSGHLSNLIVTSATCDGSEYGCTFGSQVFVTGQGKKTRCQHQQRFGRRTKTSI
jgi:hypothetical protein